MNFEEVLRQFPCEPKIPLFFRWLSRSESSSYFLRVHLRIHNIRSSGDDIIVFIRDQSIILKSHWSCMCYEPFKLQPRIMNYVTLDRGLHSNCANYVDSCASFGRKRNVTPWVIALLIVLIILIFWSRLQMMSLYKRKQLMHLLETAVVKRLVAKIPTSFYWWLCIYYGKATKIDINCYHAQLGSFVAL